MSRWSQRSYSLFASIAPAPELTRTLRGSMVITNIDPLTHLASPMEPRTGDEFYATPIDEHL